MADRGFYLDSDLPPGVSLNIPAFMNGKDQLDIFDETETRRIACQDSCREGHCMDKIFLYFENCFTN